MKVSYSEGLANHTGSESCGDAREGVCEALTGKVRPGIQPRKTSPPDADAVRRGGRQHRMRRHSKARMSPRGHRPAHVSKHLVWEPGGPAFSRAEDALGRIGKSEDVRR